MSDLPSSTEWWQGSSAPSAVRPVDLVEHDDSAVVGVTEPAVRAELAVAVVPCWQDGRVGPDTLPGEHVTVRHRRTVTESDEHVIMLCGGGQMTQRRSDPAPVQVKHPLSSTCNVPTSDSLGPEIEPRETLGRPKPPRALHPASSTPATAVTAAHRTGLVIGRPFRWGPPRGPRYHRAPGRGLGPRPGSPLVPSSHAGTRVPLRFRPSSRPPHLAVRRLRGRRRGLATPPHRRRYGGDTQRDGGHGWPRDCQDPVQVGDLPPVAHHGDEYPPECESPTNSRPEPRTARSADWVALTRRRIRASAPTAARVARSARDFAEASATEIPVAPTPTTRTAPTRISMAMSRSGSPKGDLVVPVSVSMAGGPGTARGP